MELKDNTVWIVKGNDCFGVLSSKEYAEEYKKSLIEIWRKSIIRESIPPQLNNRSEIEKSAADYPEVIQVDDDHYALSKGWASNGNKEWWRYVLMSNREWKDYSQRFHDRFVIEDYLIIK
jgi:acetone carboxylase gamma subunit